MKTVNVLIYFICLISLFQLAEAQTNYYPEAKTFYENGYTYQCDAELSGMVYLYNKNYSAIHSVQRFKATGEQIIHDYSFVACCGLQLIDGLMKQS